LGIAGLCEMVRGTCAHDAAADHNYPRPRCLGSSLPLNAHPVRTQCNARAYNAWTGSGMHQPRPFYMKAAVLRQLLVAWALASVPNAADAQGQTKKKEVHA
jgi:hypothetical protein